MSKNTLRRVLDQLQEMDFVGTTGRTSGLRYILHKSKSKTTEKKIKYSELKQQEKIEQQEAILRYLSSFDTITNAEARKLLKLPDSAVSQVSRLLSEMLQAKSAGIKNSSKQQEKSICKK